MARYNAIPRTGHLQAMQRAFGYIKHYPKVSIQYDETMPDLTTHKPTTYDWEQFYPGLTEELPPDMPTPKGNPARITGYFDADHAGCLQTRRSVTGVIMFVNNTPIKWYSKRQNTVESSTYGSELVAGRIATELAIEMRYKLRMVGIPLQGSCVLFGDNQSVVMNTTIPSSMLKKKHNAIAYHRVREAIAARVIDVVHCRSKENLADIFTKALGPMVHRGLLEWRGFPKLGKNEGEYQRDTNTPATIPQTEGQGTVETVGTHMFSNGNGRLSSSESCS